MTAVSPLAHVGGEDASVTQCVSVLMTQLSVLSLVILDSSAVVEPSRGIRVLMMGEQELTMLEKYIFVVKRRVVHLTNKNQLIKTLVLQEEITGETTQQPEEACVLLETPDPFSFSPSSLVSATLVFFVCGAVVPFPFEAVVCCVVGVVRPFQYCCWDHNRLDNPWFPSS